jgi:hypothetical protein
MSSSDNHDIDISLLTYNMIGVCKITELICLPSFPLMSFSVTRITRRVSLAEQELLTLPEHLNLLPVFSGVHVSRS